MYIDLNVFFDRYSIILYYCQYYLSKLILLSNNSSSLFLILIFFIFGILTVFTPCFISMIPLAFSYISVRGNSLTNIVIFSIGLSTSSFIFILSTNVIGFYLFVGKFALFSNLFTILLSLDLMNIISFSSIYNSLKLPKNISFNKNIFLNTYFIGLIMGFSALPCNTYIFFILSFLLKNIDNILTLFMYFFIYIIGFISPVLLIFSFKLYFTSLKMLSYFWDFISSFGGSFLFIFSLFSLLNSILPQY
uniref:Thiol:disulfide interchange protein n=1 Tax=Vertebrata australis TaxID=1967852 RepID=A0A1Z1MIZ6_9FLOR|nr:thiol:disulfide interchange protein [Vertebrata australis]ARW65721.1 thiol:disulfide interchange protein [Vertebrata australis]